MGHHWRRFISFEDGNSHSVIGLFQLDYYHRDTKSLLFDAGLGKQFGTVFALYGGAGAGASTRADGIIDLGNIRFAWKAFAGARFTFGRVALRADVSYVRDIGFILGGYAGVMF